jgi:mevalonate kinase
MAEGRGFGKTIFIGDQFVLWEVPAIVAAIPFETIAVVERIEGSDWILEDNRMEVPGYKAKKYEQHLASIQRIFDVLGINPSRTPMKITYGGTLLAGSGVGASAASCVSLIRALNAEFDLGLSTEEINQAAWEGEFAYHGLPSGVDNTASTYGGILLYQVKNEQKLFETLNIPGSIDVVLANSGITADTSQLGPFLKEQQANDPAVFSTRLNTITQQAYAMKQALEAGELETVGRIMTDNHAILKEMGLSHDTLDELCSSALAHGALGAKVTGGGRGGYIVAVTPGKDRQDAVASPLEKAGYRVIRATIGQDKE